MSVSYSPVQWNRNKYFYDAVVVLLVGTYLWLFLELAPAFADYTRAPDTAIIRMRAFGTCAFLMLSAILCIGPLAVLDKRAMPLLYNRRHFGVLTFFVALAHARFVIDWYFAFSPTPKLQALFGSNTAFDQLVGFPFEWFGIFALLVLAIMAATSHDFWLSFLGPKLWKSLHVLVYPAYVSVVAHVVLGALMDDRNPLFAVVVSGCALTVAGLHVAAARVERRRLVAQQGATVDVAGPTPAWLPLGDVRELVDGRGRIVLLAGGERAAVFRDGTKVAALSNACAHQNGPLGEGRVIDGCVTCPWHGYQYRLDDGCSPAPFTERVPTYELRLDGAELLLNPVPRAPGAAPAPLEIPAALVAGAATENNQ